MCSLGYQTFHSGMLSGHYFVYGVSQGECARLRENVPYVKVHRSNPKHLIQSRTVTEIMAREKCGLLAVPCTHTVPVQLMCYPYTAHVHP